MRKIGVFTPAFSGAFLGEVLSEILRHASQIGVELNVVRTGRNDLSYDSLLATADCEAWLLILTPIHPRLVQALVAQGRPLCTIGSAAMNPHCGSARSDNALGVEMAMESLLALGHRHFAFTGGLRGLDAQERRTAFIEFLCRHQLPYDESRVVETTSYGMLGGEAGVRTLRQRGVTFTALIAGNDQNAAGALRWLRREGHPVPPPAVFGYDNAPLARDPHYQLSTMDQNLPAIVKAAFDDVLSRIEQPSLTPRTVRIPPRMVLRSSSHPGVEEAPAPVLSTTDGLLTALVSSNELIRFLHDGKVANEMEPLLTRLSLHALHGEFAQVDGFSALTTLATSDPDRLDLREVRHSLETFGRPQGGDPGTGNRLVMVVPVLLEGQVESVLAATFAMERMIEPLFLALVANELEMICFAVERSTLRERLEKQVEERTRELRLAQDELILTAQVRAMRPIVTGISHHLNTPLGNAVLAATSMKQRLAIDGDPAGYLPYVGMVVTSLERACRLVERFRDTTEVQVRGRPRAFEAEPILRQAVVAFLGATPGVSLETQWGRASCDPLRRPGGPS